MTKHKLTFLLAAALVALPMLAATPAVRTNAETFVWSSGEYHYDGAGNIISIGASSESGVPDYYTYDAVGRLTAATAHARDYRNQQTFEYDVYGNLRGVVTRSANGALPAETQDVRLDVRPDNRLGDGSGGVCPPNTSCITGRYDEAGNQVAPTIASYAQVVVGNETRLVDPYIYDPLGMMTELRDGTRTEQYLYDANNERIARIIKRPGADERRYTLRSGTSVLREYIQTVPATGAATWQWTEDYIYQGARLLAADLPNNQRHHFHPDHLGTPRLITDDSGYVVAKHTYYPFGAEAPGSTADTERMKFTGHERDFGVDRGQDLDYMHARFYKPVAGRFLTVDPGKDWDPATPQSWNLYGYVRDNPVNAIDPNGEGTQSISLGWSGAVGIARAQSLSLNFSSSGTISVLRTTSTGMATPSGGVAFSSSYSTAVTLAELQEPSRTAGISVGNRYTAGLDASFSMDGELSGGAISAGIGLRNMPLPDLHYYNDQETDVVWSLNVFEEVGHAAGYAIRDLRAAIDLYLDSTVGKFNAAAHGQPPPRSCLLPSPDEFWTPTPISGAQ